MCSSGQPKASWACSRTSPPRAPTRTAAWPGADRSLRAGRSTRPGRHPPETQGNDRRGGRASPSSAPRPGCVRAGRRALARGAIAASSCSCSVTSPEWPYHRPSCRRACGWPAGSEAKFPKLVTRARRRCRPRKQIGLRTHWAVGDGHRSRQHRGSPGTAAVTRLGLLWAGCSPPGPRTTGDVASPAPRSGQRRALARPGRCRVRWPMRLSRLRLADRSIVVIGGGFIRLGGGGPPRCKERPGGHRVRAAPAAGAAMLAPMLMGLGTPPFTARAWRGPGVDALAPEPSGAMQTLGSLRRVRLGDLSARSLRADRRAGRGRGRLTTRPGPARPGWHAIAGIGGCERPRAHAAIR